MLASPRASGSIPRNWLGPRASRSWPGTGCPKARQDGLRRDIQLKGSGRTPFSRGADGRAALGPVLREYVISEAMAALGVPTTRALAAVVTGQPVLRETALPGAVLTRVAASHIRVGTFQYIAAQGDTEACGGWRTM